MQSSEALEDRVRGEMQDLREGFVVLVLTSAEDFFRATTALLNYVVNEASMSGVYITASRPYVYLSKAFQDKGINTDNILFIDCISALAGEHGDRKGNCVFVENPVSLESISTQLDNLLSEIGPKKSFIFLDSLSTFLIYNSESSVAKFSHLLINKLRVLQTSGVFMSLEKEAPTETIQRLIQICDKLVKLY